MFSRKFSRAKARGFKANFKSRWRDFLHAHFDGPAHVSYIFAVDASTGQNWWDGLHAPSGPSVAYAYNQYPVEASKWLGAV